MTNQDSRTVAGFGDEWTRFPQDRLSDAEASRIFGDYFAIFPWQSLSGDAVGADIGCGSGRWAKLAAPRVGRLELVDASDAALAVARRNLAGCTNCGFHHASVDALPFADGSLDFAYSLGVLHHVPNTAAALAAVAAKLKPGAPILVYLYYAFDSRPLWFRGLWRLSDALRRGVSRLPHSLRYLASQAAAFGIYWPLARSARLLEHLGRMPASFPLAYYRDKSLYVLRTDALDRFGTRLEQRFTQAQIRAMLEAAGCRDVRFSDRAPYWCALAIKA